jgi:hypothetical protein
VEALVAGSEREEAQRRRAEARQRRRGQDEAPAPATADDSGGADEPLDTVKHAAKVAAAAAAVGAAVGAAKAIAGGDDEKGPETAEENPKPVSEARAPEDETAEEQPAEEPQDEPAKEPREEPQAERDEQPARTGPPAGDAREVVRSAREQLAALLGSEPESVSGFERTDDGWTITLEVVEVSRIPESTDVLASYELTLDRDRNLVRYHRGRRYYRSQADAGDGS